MNSGKKRQISVAKQHNIEEIICGPAMELAAEHTASDTMIRPVEASCLLI